MAEFCFECYKKYYNKNAKPEDIVISKELDLCEGCTQLKKIVIKIKTPFIFRFIP